MHLYNEMLTADNVKALQTQKCEDAKDVGELIMLGLLAFNCPKP